MFGKKNRRELNTKQDTNLSNLIVIHIQKLNRPHFNPQTLKLFAAKQFKNSAFIGQNEPFM